MSARVWMCACPCGLLATCPRALATIGRHTGCTAQPKTLSTTLAMYTETLAAASCGEQFRVVATLERDGRYMVSEKLTSVLEQETTARIITRRFMEYRS